MTRVAVFLDYQNVYMGARLAFGSRQGHFTFGQTDPLRLGLLVTSAGSVVDPERRLETVRAYCGEPSALHSPKGQMACQRQVERWNADPRVHAVTRALRYQRTPGSTGFHAEEKGIDVLVALGMVMGAMRDEYDVAVLFSGDSDLLPAIEAVMSLGKRCEVVAWRGRVARSVRLRPPKARIWCHWLDERAYAAVHDPTDYTAPAARDAQADPSPAERPPPPSAAAPTDPPSRR